MSGNFTLQKHRFDEFYGIEWEESGGVGINVGIDIAAPVSGGGVIFLLSDWAFEGLSPNRTSNFFLASDGSFSAADPTARAPEPGTLALMFIALLMLSAVRVRRVRIRSH